MTMIRGEDYNEILRQLEDVIKITNFKRVLRCPNSRTRPGIGLIGSYKWSFQIIQIDFSWGMILGQVIVILGAWFSLLQSISPTHSNPILGKIFSVVLANVFATIAFALLLLLFSAFLRGKLSLFWAHWILISMAFITSLPRGGLLHIGPR